MNAKSELQVQETDLDGQNVKRSGHECLVVVYAPSPTDLGRRYVLDLPSTAIGRGRDNDILLRSESVSRRHARLEHRADGLYLLDLDSTNGTFVNDGEQRVGQRRLRRGDQFSIGDTIFEYLSGDDIESQYHDLAFRMAITDGLTGLANRKQLDTVVGEELPRAQRQGRQLSLLLIDIDHFSTINESYGRVTGDSVLASLATALQKRTRPHDKLGRYGGEEFCLVLPETSLSSAVRVAEEIRAFVADQILAAEGQELQVTVSIGAATATPTITIEQLYAAADEMLHKAKSAGRNRVCY